MISTLNNIFDTRIDTHKIYVSMKTKFILRNYPGRNMLPVYLHITGNGKRERLHLDIEVQKERWNSKNQRLNNYQKNASGQKEEIKNLTDLNLILDNVAAKVTNIKTVYRLSEMVLSPKKLKKELINDLPRVKFCSFFKLALQEDKPKLAPGTFRKIETVLNKIIDYDGEVVFSDLTETWFDRYKSYLHKKGNKKTTINSNIKTIKKYLRAAVKSGIKIPVSIDDIKAGSTTGNRISLNTTELKKIYQFYNSEFVAPTHQIILGYFLFSCMTGLRFSDIMNIEPNMLDDNYIQFVTEKTEKTQIINLNKNAKKIIESCQKLFYVKFTNEYINRELKVIMRNLSIKKRVTFHVARHTFATSFLRAGGKVENLQLLLGHSSITQTMIYTHIVASEANKEIYLLDNLI